MSGIERVGIKETIASPIDRAVIEGVNTHIEKDFGFVQQSEEPVN